LFEITNEATGTVFSASADESILDAGLRQGYVLPYSCRDGACGSCRAELVAGEFDYPAGDPDALTEADRLTGKVLLCKAHARSNIKIRAREAVRAAGVTIKTLPCRVHELDLITHDVMRVRLNLPRTQTLEYLAGQYLDIILRDGRRRSFSIANQPGTDDALELHIRKVDGGRFSEQVFNSMKAGDLLRFEGPLGTFYLQEQLSREVIFVAGGTGFAPIKAILEEGFSKEKFANTQVHLYWGVRTVADLYLQNLIQNWVAQNTNLTYTPVLSEPPKDGWEGETGWVHEQVLAQHANLDNLEVYASGPPPMVSALRDDFKKAGMRDENFFFDSFEFSVDQ